MKKIISLATVLAFPTLVFAQTIPNGPPTLDNVVILTDSIGYIIGLLLPITVAAALLAFFWGLAKFIYTSGDETAKKEGKQLMIWGVVALFIMVSVWGLVRFIGSAVGVRQGDNGLVPGVMSLPR